MAHTQVKLLTGETLEIDQPYATVRTAVVTAMGKRNELVKFTARDIGDIEVLPEAIGYIYFVSGS